MERPFNASEAIGYRSEMAEDNAVTPKYQHEPLAGKNKGQEDILSNVVQAA